MLIIREKQLEKLRGIPRTSFENSLIRHFFQLYPFECTSLGCDQIRKAVHYGLEQAENHGYYSQREAATYTSLLFILGNKFDQDPQLPWVAEQVDDLSIAAPLARIQRLYRSTIEYMEIIAGAESEHLVRALLRARDYTIESIPRDPVAEYENDFLARLRHLYPQKSDFQGDSLMCAWMQEGIRSAKEYGFTDMRGVFIYIALQFFLGSGFDKDPLYPWAEETLTNPAVTNAVERYSQLYRKAKDYLNKVISSWQT
jgi:hypothetical protein